MPSFSLLRVATVVVFFVMRIILVHSGDFIKQSATQRISEWGVYIVDFGILFALFLVAESTGITLLNLKEALESRDPQVPRRCPPLDVELILHLILPRDKCDDEVSTLEELYGKKQ